MRNGFYVHLWSHWEEDGAMYDIGFQNLSRMMASGKTDQGSRCRHASIFQHRWPGLYLRICWSGFCIWLQYGKVIKGKSEPRKEIGLIAMAHRNTYVLQATMANTSHMIEGFIDGLMAKRPAIFNLYTTCQPEHGVGDDLGAHQAKLAVESRAYPVYKFNPEMGVTPEEAFDLSGNPDMNQIWPTYQLKYKENGREKSMEVAMTFADFAITEGRFRKHFRKVPRDAWNNNMILLSEFLELDSDAREGKFPFIWAVNKKQQLTKVMVASKIVESCEERRDFWIMLKALAGVKDPLPTPEDLESKIRNEVVGKIAAGLLQLAGGDGTGLVELANSEETTESTQDNAGIIGESMSPWLDTDDCTSCDECIKINPNIFAYNEDKKAFIHNPHGGPYQDLVKAAEEMYGDSNSSWIASGSQ